MAQPRPRAKFGHQLSLGFFSSAITMVLQQSEQAPHCFSGAFTDCCSERGKGSPACPMTVAFPDHTAELDERDGAAPTMAGYGPFQGEPIHWPQTGIGELP